MCGIRPIIKVWFRAVINHAAAVADKRRLSCVTAGVREIVFANGTTIGFAAGTAPSVKRAVSAKMLFRTMYFV